jgi:hypothetical protein
MRRMTSFGDKMIKVDTAMCSKNEILLLLEVVLPSQPEAL